MLKQLQVKNFAQYDKHKNEIQNKIFLYDDHDTNLEEIEWNGITYRLEDPAGIDLPGQVTDPAHSVGRSLFGIYEWALLKASFCDGYLLCYLDFITGSDSEAKQLKFKVYRLNKVN